MRLGGSTTWWLIPPAPSPSPSPGGRDIRSRSPPCSLKIRSRRGGMWEHTILHANHRPSIHSRDPPRAMPASPTSTNSYAPIPTNTIVLRTPCPTRVKALQRTLAHNLKQLTLLSMPMPMPNCKKECYYSYLATGVGFLGGPVVLWGVQKYFYSYFYCTW